nr:CHAT domain-containing protein [Nitrosomonas nitrosa]
MERAHKQQALIRNLLATTSHLLSQELSPGAPVQKMIIENETLIDENIFSAYEYVVFSIFDQAKSSDEIKSLGITIGDFGWALGDLVYRRNVYAKLSLLAAQTCITLIRPLVHDDRIITFAMHRVGTALLALATDSNSAEFRKAVTIFQQILNSKELNIRIRRDLALKIVADLLRWYEHTHDRSIATLALPILQEALKETSWVDSTEERSKALLYLAQLHIQVTTGTGWEDLREGLKACEELNKHVDEHRAANFWIRIQLLKGSALINKSRITTVETEQSFLLEQAIETLTNARRVCKREGDHLNSACAGLNLGDAYFHRVLEDRQRNAMRAIELTECSLKFFRTINDPNLVLVACGNLGNYYLEVDPGRSIAFFEEALRLALASNSQIKVGEFHACLGVAHTKLPSATGHQNHPVAEHHFEKSIELLKTKNNRPLYFDALKRYKTYLMATHLWPKAVQITNRMVDLVEEWRHETIDDSMKQTLLDQALNVYSEAAECAIETGAHKTAWLYLLMSKARLSVERRFLMYTSDMTRRLFDLQALIRKLEVDISKLTRLKHLDSVDQKIQEESTHFLQQYQEIEGQLAQCRQELAATMEGKSVSPTLDRAWFEDAIPRIWGELAPTQSVLLDWYRLTSGRLVLFLVDPCKDDLSYRIYDSEVSKTIIQLYFSGPTGYFKDDLGPWKEHLKDTLLAISNLLQLDKVLPEPVLTRTRKVLISPIHLLHMIPFHALVLRGRSLVDVVPDGIHYTANSTMLLTPSAPEKIRAGYLTTLTTKDTNLPFAQLETEYIRHAWKERMELPISSEEGSLKPLLEGAQHIHVSSHGYLGFLTAAETTSSAKDLRYEDVIGLDLRNCNLVVLSLCEGGLTDLSSSSDDSISFAGAFKTAGASNVISALWPVDDFATLVLMIRYYEMLFEKDTAAIYPKAILCLAEAQRWMKEVRGDELYEWIHKLIRFIPLESPAAKLLVGYARTFSEAEKPFSNPLYWAPFVIC